jgi:hypothetical protein
VFEGTAAVRALAVPANTRASASIAPERRRMKEKDMYRFELRVDSSMSDLSYLHAAGTSRWPVL